MPTERHVLAGTRCTHMRWLRSAFEAEAAALDESLEAFLPFTGRHDPPPPSPASPCHLACQFLE
eukprot:6762324-Pyramimonas_sp.AAC.1